MAKRKYADIDPRGAPVNKAATKGGPIKGVYMRVPEVTWHSFKEHAAKMRLTPRDLIQELILSSLDALGENREEGLPSNWYDNNKVSRRHVHVVPAITVAIDEADFPSRDRTALEDLDPYMSSALVEKDAPEYQYETKQMRKIERENQRCANAVTDPRVSNRWTSV